MRQFSSVRVSPLTRKSFFLAQMNVSATDPLECFRDDNYMATKQRRNLADKKGGAG